MRFSLRLAFRRKPFLSLVRQRSLAWPACALRPDADAKILAGQARTADKTLTNADENQVLNPRLLASIRGCKLHQFNFLRGACRALCTQTKAHK